MNLLSVHPQEVWSVKFWIKLWSVGETEETVQCPTSEGVQLEYQEQKWGTEPTRSSARSLFLQLLQKPPINGPVSSPLPLACSQSCQ